MSAQLRLGKTALSIELAKQFSGEVISADSRQVYRGPDIGTEKVTAAEMRGIPHHLLDVVVTDLLEKDTLELENRPDKIENLARYVNVGKISDA